MRWEEDGCQSETVQVKTDGAETAAAAVDGATAVGAEEYGRKVRDLMDQ